MKNMFRAYDIRGIFGSELSVDVMLRIGKALGSYVREEFGERPISLGHDIRTSSPALSMALKAGLISRGVDVMDAGEVAFGEALFTGHSSDVPLIAFITASHLPSRWNGLKLYYGDGVGLPTEELMKIRDMAMDDTGTDVAWDSVGHGSVIDMHREYIDHLARAFDLSAAGMRIAVDCGSGSASLTAPGVLEAAGFKVERVFCDPDPSFPTRDPEPAPENLGRLRQVVVERGCDLGVAFDGDGDRAVVVDGKGRALGADITGVIMARYLVENGRPRTVIVNVESSRLVEAVLDPMGVRVMRIKVGHTYLTLEAKRNNAAIGFERSGHVIIPEIFLFDDALVVPLMLGRLLMESSVDLAGLVDRLPVFHTRSVKIDVPDAEKFDVIARVQESFRANFERVNTLDGARVDLEKGWVLIRASNTSPMIRLTAEAVDRESLDELVATFGKLLESHIRA